MGALWSVSNVCLDNYKGYKKTYLLNALTLLHLSGFGQLQPPPLIAIAVFSHRSDCQG